jgi:hypothetical protein
VLDDDVCNGLEAEDLLGQLTVALAQGKDVRWASHGYKVWWDNDKICAIFTENGFNCALSADEVEQCYIKGEA